MGYNEGELSLVLVDDAGITLLNQEYFHRHGPTNVIAFPMSAGEFSQVNPGLLGDVVVSVERAAVEGEDSGYSPEEMLDFYLIHGILHLLGYDHEASVEEAARMEAKTLELMRVLGH